MLATPAEKQEALPNVMFLQCRFDFEGSAGPAATGAELSNPRHQLAFSSISGPVVTPAH
jgi:hypothetical protein